jgi:hypothetical protein
MRVFLDFEASSLGKHSYPIEVAWVFEDGNAESYLIKPAPDRTDWDEEAETIHHISRDTLQSEGKPHDWVAHRMIETLSDHKLFASAPSWDGKWLSVLLRAAGRPRHELRLKDTEEVQIACIRQTLRARGVTEELTARAREILAEARRPYEKAEPAHRATADAERERTIWLEGKRLAEEWPARAG